MPLTLLPAPPRIQKAIYTSVMANQLTLLQQGGDGGQIIPHTLILAPRIFRSAYGPDY